MEMKNFKNFKNMMNIKMILKKKSDNKNWKLKNKRKKKMVLINCLLHLEENQKEK